MDEPEAITRLKRGDISGLAILVERYQVRAVRTAYLITQDRALAEDVVQSTFMRVYHRIQQFDSSRPFAPWFLRSVVNAAIQAAQQRERSSSLETLTTDGEHEVTLADLIVDTAPTLDDALEQAERREVVRIALQKLSPEQRAAVVMRYYLDRTEHEMADELDCPPGTIKWRLHAARKQLRALLVNTMPDWKG